MKKICKTICVLLVLVVVTGAVFNTNAFAVVPSIKSDTPKSITLPQVYTYTFKMTVNDTSVKPNFTVGNSDIMEIYSLRKSGNDYYIKVIPTGKVGSATGLYSTISGYKPQLLCTMTVGEFKLNPNGECLSGIEGSRDDTLYDTSETYVYKNNVLVHIYAHTGVGDVEVVESWSKFNKDELIAAAFKKAHPDWHGAYWEGNVWYDKKAYDGVSTYEDVVEYCNGNSDNISKMSQEQLYTLSGMINSDDSKTRGFCSKEFNSAWNKKMEWYVNKYAGWTHTVGFGAIEEEIEDTSEPTRF